VRVVWDRHSRPRCRFSIDDNSFFLRDIAQQKYASLFDCFYLDLLRSLHKKYGVRFVLNIYYTTGDDFELPQFSARYKGEWEENSDWLKLAFHAHANEPARPYQYAPAEIMDLFTHEQYFWPFYSHYLPDHGKRLEVAIRWVTEHGYEPVFFHEGFLGVSAS